MKRLLIAGCIIATASSAGAQATGDATAALKAGYTEVSEWVIKAAATVPADKYTYKPVGTVRSVGEMVAHVVDGYNYYCGMAAGKRPQWTDAVEKGKTDKASVTAALKTATDACAAVYAGTGAVAPLLANIGHTNLHYGNLITYLRMLGLTPPSS